MAANIRHIPDRRPVLAGWILTCVVATLALGGLSDRAEASSAPPVEARR